MATNFSHLLDKPVDSVKRPPVKPAGTYYANIESFKFDESKNEKTPYVRFTFNNLQPGPDIHPDQLKDTDGEDIEFSKWKPWRDFYLTENALYRLREFLESLSIPTNGRSFNSTIPETRGLPVILTIVQTPSNKPGDDSIYNNVSDAKGQH
jgi:hypothetical protein